MLTATGSASAASHTATWGGISRISNSLMADAWQTPYAFLAEFARAMEKQKEAPVPARLPSAGDGVCVLDGRRGATLASGPAMQQQRDWAAALRTSPRMVLQRQRIAESFGRLPTQAAETGRPLQKVKIKLKDEDAELMDRLRTVAVPNAGGQTLNDPGGIANLNQINQTEAIVFEGHGYYNDPLIGRAKVVSQGGVAPRRLAELAHSVPKPDNWDGEIILLGCSTGDITEKVSQEYFKLARKPALVIGTQKNIRVGTKANGRVFVGSDWESYPENERPADLAFSQELQGVVVEFWQRVRELVGVGKDLVDFQKQVVNGLSSVDPVGFAANGYQHTFTRTTANLNTIIAGASKIRLVDATSANAKSDGKDYGLDERKQLYDHFEDVIRALHALPVLTFPDSLQFDINVNAADVPALQARGQVFAGYVAQFTASRLALQTLQQQGSPLWENLRYFTLGLTLKEIDLSDATQAVHHKAVRTKESILGDTWVNNA